MLKAYQKDEAKNYVAKELPAWRVEGNQLVRTYRTGGWQTTLLLVNTIGFLAEAAWHHPDLEVGYQRVTVRLQTHDAGNVITEKDFELARKIEDVVLWQPAAGDALDGTTAPWVST